MTKHLGRILLFIMLIWLPVSQAWSDGGYFSSSRSIAISADQRVIIIKNGNEISMTFSTGYTGEGEDFGWIIPTPVPPDIEDVSEAGENGERLSITGVASRYERTEVYNLTVEDYHSYAVHRSGILIHNKGGHEAPGPKQLVKVYGTITLEHYEVSILGAADASTLLNWLRKNDYQVNSAAEKVLDTYIEQNWAFVAVKLNPSERRHYENEFLPLLTIRYEYDQLIFPLRVSSVSTTRSAKITQPSDRDAAVSRRAPRTNRS